MGLGDLWNDITGKSGADRAAQAAQEAALAQERAAHERVELAKQTVENQKKTRAEAMQAAQLKPEEISQINSILETRDKSLQSSLDSIGKQQSALDAMDPQVKAAGKNFYELISGKSAEMLAPMQAVLDKQRKSLTSNLAAQMGPGFMTSSAGIQALTAFDTQSALTLGQAQIQAINTIGNQYATLSGLQQQGQNAITGSTLSAFGQAQTATAAALQGYQVGQSRVMQAMALNPVDETLPVNAFGDVVKTAGANQTYGQYMGQWESSHAFLPTLITSGTTMASSYLGKNAAAKPGGGATGATGATGADLAGAEAAAGGEGAAASALPLAFA